MPSALDGRIPGRHKIVLNLAAVDIPSYSATRQRASDDLSTYRIRIRHRSDSVNGLLIATRAHLTPLDKIISFVKETHAALMLKLYVQQEGRNRSLDVI